MTADIFESELQSLAELYVSLENQLESEFQRLQAGQVSAQSELDAAGALVARLCEADKRVARLAGVWPVCRLQFSGDERVRVQSLASVVQEQARLLASHSLRNERLLRRLQDSVLNSLREIRAGSRYVQSVKGQHENHPRFIDAHR
jgi:hypothetical protein